MSGLLGVSTSGVGHDISRYLKELALFFKVNITVTSGYRTGAGQAHAMFNNWVKLKHGEVYKLSALSVSDRTKLQGLYKAAHNSLSTAVARDKAKADFLKLAESTVGAKSLHTRGRAIDVSRAHINSKIYHAITLYLHDVKEGNRTDIYHLESVRQVPVVDATIRAKWQAIHDGKAVPVAKAPHPQHH